MAVPSEVTAWATSGSALKTPIDVTRQNLGWQTLPDNLPTQTGERPNLNEQNYWQNAVHTWIQYLNTEISTDTGTGAYVRQTSPTINTPTISGGTFTGALSGATGTYNGSINSGGTFTGALNAATGTYNGAHSVGSVAESIVTGASGTGVLLRVGGTFTGTHSSGSVNGAIVGSGIPAANLSGQVAVGLGGTGLSSVTAGYALLGDGANNLIPTQTTGSGDVVRSTSPTFYTSVLCLGTFQSAGAASFGGGLPSGTVDIIHDGSQANGWCMSLVNNSNAATAGGILVTGAGGALQPLLQVNSAGSSVIFKVEGNGVLTGNAASWSSSAGTKVVLSGAAGFNFQKESSARKYKTEIREYDGGSEWIYDLAPIFYRYKSNQEMRGGKCPEWVPQATRSVGYTADDVLKIAPEQFIFFNEDKKTGNKEVEALHYHLFVVPIIEQLAKHDRMIKELAGI